MSAGLSADAQHIITELRGTDGDVGNIGPNDIDVEVDNGGEEWEPDPEDHQQDPTIVHALRDL